jgi:PAS domain S-box-containing protein
LEAQKTSYLKRLGAIPIIALTILIAFAVILNTGKPVFNPPNLAFILQILFVLIASLTVAIVSARGYLTNGSLNLVFLGAALLINGTITTISVVPLGLSSNEIVTMANLGTLTSAIILFLSAIITLQGTVPSNIDRRKIILIITYFASILLIGVLIALALSNVLPVFLTSTGPTLLRRTVLAALIVMLFGSFVIFEYRYFKTKSPILYWYSLALALFGLAMVAAYFTVKLGDPMNWLSRITIYLSGIYFIIALLSRATSEESDVGLSTKWAEAFRSNPEQLATFFSRMLDGFAYCKIITDKSGKPIDYVYLDVNEAFARNLGLKRESILGKKATEVLKEGKIPEDWMEISSHVALNCEPTTSELYSQETEKWFHVSLYCPQRGHFVSISEDITQRKQLEREIEVIARFPSENPNPIFRIDGKGTILYGNMAGDSLLATWNCKVGERAPEHISQAVANALSSDKRTELEETYGNKALSFLFVPITSEGYVNIYANDITERKKAEEALRASEQRWATTLASIGDAVIATDTSGKIMFMNIEAEELTGWTLSEVLQKPVKTSFNIVNEQTRLEVENPIERVLREGMVIGLANHTVLIRKDGVEVPIDDSGAPIKDKEGKTTGVVLIFRDITERKEAEEKLEEYRNNLEKLVEERTFSLKESEEKYRTLFDSIDEGFCIIEMVFDSNYKPLDYRFLEINASFERQTGMHDAKGKLMRSFAPNHESYWFEIYGKVALTGQPIRFTNEAKALNRYYDVYAFPVGEGKIRNVGILFNDISQRRNLEIQLKDAERLAAIGATAGMVGHDIRNPLQAITGDVFLAKTDLTAIPESEEKKSIQESLSEIEKNVDYINKIVQDLQDFARPLKPNAEETDIKLIIEDLLKKNALPENVKVTVKVDTDARKVVADSTFINRIMYNLVNNAVQAMPKGGKLTIHAYKEAKDIVIAVKDTGVGIPDAAKGKLFTPMFTTKSKGQGFGLPVIKRMTEALGGTVTFESQEGKGTTFIIRLPPAKS